MNRRQMLKSSSASLVLWNTQLVSMSNASVSSKKPRIIWVVLRGALDGLHTVVPRFEKKLDVLRPNLSRAISDTLLPLDSQFGLHPSLKNLHGWFKSSQLLPIVAVSTGYSKRSHFDGQDYLECGKACPDLDSGWLGRALNIRKKKAVAISNTVSLSLRQGERIETWYPSILEDADESLYLDILELYRYDEKLLKGLKSGMSMRKMAPEEISKRQRGNFRTLARGCASLMDGADCAMLELRGWDTHSNQVGRLKRLLTELDLGLADIKVGLGSKWSSTIVIVATEFGRTATENGTKGTDHGTGTAMFIAGGAVAGGRVLGDWPGLEKAQLVKERDLAPTTNTFAWIATILQQHWGLSDREILNVFPTVSPYKKTIVLKNGQD